MEVVIDGVRYVPDIKQVSDNVISDYMQHILNTVLNVSSMTHLDDSSMTLREYLQLILTTLWREGENFNSKRPFGDSAWKLEVYAHLIEFGFFPGTLDSDGYVEEIDIKQADEFIQLLIKTAFHGKIQ